MIPGKKYRPEDYLTAAWRRRWVIIVPLVSIALCTFVFVKMLPDRYRSEAVLLIIPPRVPQNYVRPTITARIDERIQSIGQELWTRSRLEGIITEFNLYPDERKRLLMDDVVELMRRRDAAFSPPRLRRSDADAGSFTVSFEYSDPRTAMLVAERLASLFVLENIEERTGLVEQTDKFLESQLDEARRKLIDHEKKLETFRRSHPGLMPTQLDSNQQALSNAQLQLQAVQEAINRDRDRQLEVRRQINELLQAAAYQPPIPAPPDAPTTAAEQLERARAALKAARMRLTEDHPDIRAMNRAIKELEQKAAEEELRRPVSAAPVIAGDSGRTQKLNDLRAEEDTITRRLNQRQGDEKRLLDTMSMYRQRLEAAPAVESEVTELMRDYTTLQTAYQNLLAKSQDAKVSANLERRQIGEQFKIIDPPRMAVRPTSPNRLRFNLMGIIAGIAVGLGLAALLEYRDSSLRTEDDVVVALSLPVLAMVPTMTTTVERKKWKRQRLLLASSGALALVLCIAVLAWKFRLLNEWMW